MSGVALFALSQSEFLEYETLPLEASKMMLVNIADAVIRSTASGVGPPVQVAVVTSSQATTLDPVELRGLEDSVAAFREHQRNFLVDAEPPGTGMDTGLRP